MQGHGGHPIERIICCSDVIQLTRPALAAKRIAWAVHAKAGVSGECRTQSFLTLL